MDPLNHPVLMQRGPLVINITDPTKCYYCHTGPLTSNDRYCPSCGFPQNGPEDEQKRFITHKRILLGHLNSVSDNVSKARNGLIGAAALYGISYALGAITNDNDVPTYIEGAVIAMIFAGLAIYSNKNAYAAALAGLIVFGTIIVVRAVVFPREIVSGIYWKIIIFSSLIYGMRAARDYKRLHAELVENKIDLTAGNIS